MRTLRAFLWGVLSSWWGIMTGAFGVLLSAAGSTTWFGDTATLRRIFWVGGALLLCVATFSAWLKEYHARLAAETAAELALRAARDAHDKAIRETQASHDKAAQETRAAHEATTQRLEQTVREVRELLEAKPVRCERCERNVPKWFSGALLPKMTMSDRAFWLTTHKGIGARLDQAQREALIMKGLYDEVGCMVCAGTAPIYPADGETREAFTARALGVGGHVPSPETR